MYNTYNTCLWNKEQIGVGPWHLNRVRSERLSYLRRPYRAEQCSERMMGTGTQFDGSSSPQYCKHVHLYDFSVPVPDLCRTRTA